ncbi:MAG: hypothetical protein JXB47_14260 [Anaerolineae bacterium]|nr:hypothetical protein [Anaerolineae bacterium]
MARELKEEIFPSLKIQPHKSANVRACFELSYRRLDKQVAGLFRFLGQFPQPFDVEAVAYVLGQKPERISRDFRSLTLAGLVDVVPSESQQYQLHRLLHEYARTLSQEQDEAQHPEWERRFAEHYLKVTQDAWQSWLDGDERQALQIWQRNLKHIEQGFDYASASDHTDWILKYLLSTGFYLGYGGFREIVERWRAQFERLIPNDKDSVLGKLCLGDAYLLLRAPRLAVEVLAHARDQAADERLWLTAVLKLAQAFLALGQYHHVLELFDEPTYQQAIETLPAEDELWIEEKIARGRAYQIMGRYTDARCCYLNAVDVLEKNSPPGYIWARTALLTSLGEGLLTLEELDAAVQVFEDGLQLAKTGGYDNFAQNLALYSAIALARLGRVSEARDKLQGVLGQGDVVYLEALALFAQAEVSYAEGQPNQAVRYYEMAAQASAGTLTEIDILLRLGEVLQQMGDWERAAAIWQQARDCTKEISR